MVGEKRVSAAALVQVAVGVTGLWAVIGAGLPWGWCTPIGTPTPRQHPGRDSPEIAQLLTSLHYNTTKDRALPEHCTIFG